MTTDHDDPTRHHERFVAAFNARDAGALDALYEDQAVLVPAPGAPATGPARSAATRHLMDMGLPMEAHLRHAYVAGDIALLIVDWSLRGTTPDGTDVDMSGTATDVIRRTPDGTWRYTIDNPFGTAHPTPST